MVSDHASKAAILHAFYSGLLGQADQCSDMPELAPLLSCTTLTTGQAAALVEPFSLDELKTILFPMKIDTAPGPDGFTPLFFRANWELVKHDLLAFLNAFHAGTADLERVNKAYLALLPKKAASLLAKDYRPISLQNCVTKICTKGMTLRLQPFIPHLVHSDQTGFIKGRCIAENFIYATEVVQCCHKRGASAIILKLDFRKAFDSVDWHALDAILLAKGFPARWRTWITNLNTMAGQKTRYPIPEPEKPEPEPEKSEPEKPEP